MSLKINSGIFVLVLFSFISCEKKQKDMGTMSEKTQTKIIQHLIAQYGESERSRIEKGVAQVAMFWRSEDGTESDFEQFCLKHFHPSDKLFDLYQKLERNIEIISGLFNKMNVLLQFPIHVEDGKEITDIDLLFGAYSPDAHFEDDFFKNKIAFIFLLNFPHYKLDEKNAHGTSWDDIQWAYARMGDAFVSRVPSELHQQLATSMTESEAYISNYNIYMGNLRDDKNIKYFPDDLKLISHWGLRDELKAQYALEDGLPRQRMIYQVMRRIITQEIPIEVINKNEFIWNPFNNKIYRKDGSEIASTPENSARYEYLRKNFLAVKAMDPYYPFYKNYIDRHFEGYMQMTQEQVEKLFIDFISSPVMKQIGELISKRLGRPLEPFDIWYDGFKSRSAIAETELNKMVAKKYPNIEAFQNGIEEILRQLQFEPDKAKFIASRIKVDPARGAGHAWGARMRDDFARLRTRVPETGMDYKGFNIAMHELGHNVEQTITLHYVSNYMLSDVPNTAFTEALAFMFQKRDMDVLGLKRADEHYEVLDLAWSLYEIMGVALVDMNLWKWLYQNPDATSEQIRNKTIEIAKDIWNKYYAPVFGIKDQEILAIYSHMIDYPLYLSAYPLGHLIEFQLERAIEGKPFGVEVVRIFSVGNLTPDIWMKRNTGDVLKVEYLLSAAQEALKKISH